VTAAGDGRGGGSTLRAQKSGGWGAGINQGARGYRGVETGSVRGEKGGVLEALKPWEESRGNGGGLRRKRGGEGEQLVTQRGNVWGGGA